jgi:hypothetical protein
MIKELKWWGYAILSIALLFFLLPALFSAKDTLSVIVGIALLLAYLRWSWSFWIRPLFDWLIEHGEL